MYIGPTFVELRSTHRSSYSSPGENDPDRSPFPLIEPSA
jgi:hypothetical protein